MFLFLLGLMLLAGSKRLSMLKVTVFWSLSYIGCDIDLDGLSYVSLSLDGETEIRVPKLMLSF